jgi:hypothetical protein
MEGFSFVTPVTDLNRPNTGNDDEDVDDDIPLSQFNSTQYSLLLKKRR